MFRWFLLVLFAAFTVVTYGQNPIKVDQFGYRSQAKKVAVITDPVMGFNSGDSYAPGSSFEVKRVSDDLTIYTGSPAQWSNGDTHTQSGDRGWWFDFTTVEADGEYYILDSSTGQRSDEFIINANPYSEVMKAAGRAFYYNRCGTDKPQIYAGSDWTDGMAFSQDQSCRFIFDQSNTNLERDLSGGWFDAGDYNKYVTFTYRTLHNMLSAYEFSPDAFGDNWDIPESGNNLPDLIDELKWEYDWLIKMTNPDGSVHIKMGNKDFGTNDSSPPSSNTATRYYGPTCTSASATTASVMSHAAIVFNGFPSLSNYAQQLEDLAIASFDYTNAKIDTDGYETSCDNGEIKAGDADMVISRQQEVLVSAAVYLFELTGDAKYNNYVAANYGGLAPFATDYWAVAAQEVQDALLRYSTMSNANPAAKAAIQNSASTTVNNNGDQFFGSSDRDLYRAHIPDWSYHWGSNRPKANFGILNAHLTNYNIGNTSDLMGQAEEFLHYFHGVNPLGMVQLSNMYDLGAELSVNEIYHNWFADGTDYDHAQTSLYGPPPGYVTGGANKDFTLPNISPPYGQPSMKAYKDYNDGFPNNSWEISEPAIYYQAAYLRLLALFASEETTTSIAPHVLLEDNALEIVPNPAMTYFMVKGLLGNYNIDILNVAGQVVLSHTDLKDELNIDISSLGAGMYFIKIQHKAAIQPHVELMIKPE